MTVLINLYGGPGTGKSTTAAGIFSLLKQNDINAELITEYAKDAVWGDNLQVLENQPYILGKQYQRLLRVDGKVDFLVTDAPLLNSLLYNSIDLPELDALTLALYKRFTNRNFMLVRQKAYNPAGRVQTEEKAKLLDGRIENIRKS